jgi:hypothetical protein
MDHDQHHPARAEVIFRNGRFRVYLPDHKIVGHGENVAEAYANAVTKFEEMREAFSAAGLDAEFEQPRSRRTTPGFRSALVTGVVILAIAAGVYIALTAATRRVSVEATRTIDHLSAQITKTVDKLKGGNERQALRRLALQIIAAGEQGLPMSAEEQQKVVAALRKISSEIRPFTEAVREGFEPPPSQTGQVGSPAPQ